MAAGSNNVGGGIAGQPRVSGRVSPFAVLVTEFSGVAGGDLQGAYPNPTIKNGVVTDAKIVSVAYSKVTGAPSGLPPSGAASGDLAGTYPAPSLATTGVTAGTYEKVTVDAKGRVLAGTALAAPDLPVLVGDSGAGGVQGAAPAPAAGDASAGKFLKASGAWEVPTAASAVPSGPAGGDLTGTYPNPVLGSNVVNAAQIVSGAVTNAKIVDVAYAKVTGAPAALPPNGAASGDLAGTYPGPILAPAGTAGTYTKVTTDTKGRVVTGATLSGSDVPVFGGDSGAGGTQGAVPAPAAGDSAANKFLKADGAWEIPTATPGGVAGGDLTGTFPNPTIAADKVTTVKILDANVTTAKLADNAVTSVKITDANVTTTKIADANVTTVKIADANVTTVKILDANITTAKIADANVTTAKLANASVDTTKLAAGAVTDAKVNDVAYSKLTGAPASLPPNGAASGDLTGSYPGPSLATAGTAGTYTKVTTDTKGRVVTGATLVGTDLPVFGGDSGSGGTQGSVPAPSAGDTALNKFLKADGAWEIPTAMPGGAAGGDLTGTYPNPAIGADKVTTVKILDANVTTAKLADNAVTSVKITDANVITTKIADANVTAAKLATDSVTTIKIVDANVTTAKIAALAITDAKVNDVAYSKITGAPSSLPPSGAAGGDLTGTYPNPTIGLLKVTTGQIAALAITDAKVNDVAYTKITGAPASLPPSGAAGGDLTGTYPNPTIGLLKVTTAQIADANVTAVKLAADAVTTVKILDANVTTVKIADANITTAKILDANVTTAKLAALSVTDAKINDVAYTKITGVPAAFPPNGAAGGDLTGTYPNPTVDLLKITTGKIADAAVTTLKIADANVTTAKIADANVTTVKIAALAITDAKVNDVAYSKITGAPAALPPNGAAGGDLTGTYPNPTIGALKVTAGAIAADAVTTSKILDANVTTAKITDSAVTTVKIVDGAVTTAKLVDANVTTVKIADANVTTAKIADANVTTAKILDANVTNAKLAANAVATSNITDLNVTTAKINDSAVTTVKIVDGAVTTAKIVDLNVTTIKLADNAVTTAKIVDANVTTTKILDANVTDAKLSTTGVAAATYGSASLIPVITVNAQGRATTVTTVAPAAQVENSIVSGHTTIAPSGDAVYNALYQAPDMVAANTVQVSASSYTILATDKLIIISFAGAVSLQLPNPTTRRTIQIIGSGLATREQTPITLTRFGSETIQGLAANRQLFTPAGHWKVVSDGANWWLS